MPRKNSLKTYVEGGYYHIYNRGVEKRKIFLDNQDYSIFLYFLKECLNPPNPSEPLNFKRYINLCNEIDLLAYCLMPNHFHFQVKQNSKNGIEKLMRGIATKYVMYFNKKYKREGRLFQGVYQAVLIDREEQFLHLSRYIHLNPVELPNVGLSKLDKYPYSSYKNYLGIKKAKWLKPKEVLDCFESARRSSLSDIFSYQSFVEDYQGGEDAIKLDRITID